MTLLDLPRKTIFVLFAVPIVLSGVTAPDVDHAIELIEKRIEVKKETAKLRGDWELNQVELDQEATLLDAELKGLEEKLEVLLEINNELLAREDLASDSAEDQQRILKRLTESALSYEDRLLKLALRLPAPLRAQVQEELGEGIDRANKAISVRFQALVSALNLVHRFNQRPFFTKETYEGTGGSAKQLDTLYWGCALGFRIDPSDTVAQVGGPSGDIWVWEDAEEHLDSIRQAFSIHEGEVIPSFIQLPLRSIHE